MAKLTAATRHALPASAFGLPGERAYPMPDKAHARNAKARASQAVHEGRMSRATEARIEAKADRVLGKPRATQYGHHRGTISHGQPHHMRHMGGKG